MDWMRKLQDRYSYALLKSWRAVIDDAHIKDEKIYILKNGTKLQFKRVMRLTI